MRIGRLLLLSSSFTTLAVLVAACSSETAGLAPPVDGGGTNHDDGSVHPVDVEDVGMGDRGVGGSDANPIGNDRSASDGPTDRVVGEVGGDRADTDPRDVNDPDRSEAGGSNEGGPIPPRDVAIADVGSSTPQIPSPPLPTIETESFTPSGSTTDIADDSAIYANPTAPDLSVVIADNKDDATGGVGVFDMQGKLLQFRQDGKIGNVDLRAGFPLGGQSIVLVGANNRTTDTLIFWQLDPATRRLSEPIGESIVTTSPNYGFCLYHSATSGKFYAFVSQETGTSLMEQYELGENAGKVTAIKVRSFEVGSITEGCVADDDLGRLYVAQEDVALWRYGAEPSTGSTRTQVGAVGDGHLVMDLEGISLAKGPGTSGYLVLSLQGESRFVTYDRETNAFIRDFTVGSNGSLDATTQTDGLDISTSDLGPGFRQGALVVHDGSNTGGASSNLKYVPLQ